MPDKKASVKVRAFLRGRPSPCTAPDGQRGFIVTVGDTSGLFSDGVRVSWLGKEAIDFYEANRPDLVPGRCLDLEVCSLRSGNSELQARIQTCTLAPLSESWKKHAEKVSQPQPPQEQHAA